MLISQALRIRSKQVIAFVGAGGKSTALFRLADELVAQNQRVITTTTTHLSAAQVRGRGSVILRYGPSPAFLARVRDALRANPHVTIVGGDAPGDKVAGIPPARIEELAALEPVDAILVEADGARRLPLKAPAAHEPVVPAATTLLVPVAGMGAVGAPLDDEHVHRPRVIAALTGSQPGAEITPAILARLLSHPEGGLKGKPSAARAIVLLNQVETEAERSAARAVARLLLRHDEIDAVAIGAVRDAANPIQETCRRVAAIVLAAGAGTRMGERVKQLLPWRGRTLIQNALEIAERSQADETILVLGARADGIRAAIGLVPARIVENPDWEQGHSTSIRAGLAALGPHVDAVVFINADQPLLTPGIIDALIQRYAATGAHIVVPLYAGKRGSPALFDRTHFAELMRLHGELGGREVLAHHPVESVEFADSAAGLDIDTPEDYASLQ